MRALLGIVVATIGCGRIGFERDAPAALCSAFVELPDEMPVPSGATYHVSPSGDDSRSCAASMDPSMPRQTIMAGLSDCVQPGDTLLLRGGTYDEYVADSMGTVRGGSSWETATRVAAFPGEVPIIMPTSGVGRVLTLAEPTSSWMIFENIVFDGTFTEPTVGTAMKITYRSDPTITAHHVRFVGGEIRNSPLTGLTIDGVDCEVIGVDLHHNGTLAGATGMALHTGSLVEHSRIHDNMDRGMSLYSEGPKLTDVRIRYNAIYNNGSTLLIHSGQNVDVYRNVLWNNGGGIQIDGGAPRDVRVSHNAIVDNDGVSPFCLFITNDVSDVTFTNNICVGNPDGISDDGIGTILRANLMTDPGFVDRAAGLFELIVSSPALDSGEVLPALAYAGAAPDIGAFEAPVATEARQCDEMTIDVAVESIFPLSVENCGGFAADTPSGKIPASTCTVGASALRLTFATPVIGAATIVHDGTAVRDTTRVGATMSARMHPFTLPIAQ